MDGSAISTIQQTAIEAAKANRLETFTPAVILSHSDGSQRVESLEPFAERRARFRGTFKTTSIEDFKQYVVQRPGGDGFIDIKTMSAQVVFNLMQKALPEIGPGGTILHPPTPTGEASEVPGHGDHVALLALQPTAAFLALCRSTEGIVWKQKDFGLWLEDWGDHMAADYGAESLRADTRLTRNDPTGVKQALTAIRKLTIKASSETTHTDRDFGATRSALDNVDASSADVLPDGFKFMCTPYEGLRGISVYLRLIVLTEEDKPLLKLRWRQKAANIEAIGKDFKKVLSDDIGEAATMLLGTFQLGK